MKLAFKAALQSFGQYRNAKSIINAMQNDMQITFLQRKKNLTNPLFK